MEKINWRNLRVQEFYSPAVACHARVKLLPMLAPFTLSVMYSRKAHLISFLICSTLTPESTGTRRPYSFGTARRINFIIRTDSRLKEQV